MCNFIRPVLALSVHKRVLFVRLVINPDSSVHVSNDCPYLIPFEFIYTIQFYALLLILSLQLCPYGIN